jgi:hypothetical protein
VPLNYYYYYYYLHELQMGFYWVAVVLHTSPWRGAEVIELAAHNLNSALVKADLVPI